MAEIRGQETFNGQVLHSSQLDDAELEGKRVVIVGSGASGVEAAELCVTKKAKEAVVLARDDKWFVPSLNLFEHYLTSTLPPCCRIIPRNTVFDSLLACQ